MSQNSQGSAPKWMKLTLRIAGIYNLAWGVVVIISPLLLFRWAGMEEPRYPQIWQCVGMIVGVYGLGYWIAAYDPYRHWPIVLVGFLGKVFGPIGFLQAAMAGDLPWAWGATIITNDLIWWVPFAVMLYGAFRANTDTSRRTETRALENVVGEFRSNRDTTLLELSSTSPTLVVFLRHAGCTFCRETLAELRRNRKAIEATGTTLAIVHMGSPMDGTLMLQPYELDGVHRFSDPKCDLYKAFGLERGTARQLFGPSVVRRGLEVALRGHGIGLLKGDGFRMSGTFVLTRGKIEGAYRSTTAADVVDYLRMAKQASLNWGNTSDTSSSQSEEKSKLAREIHSSQHEALVWGEH